jgi:hypothetical protein
MVGITEEAMFRFIMTWVICGMIQLTGVFGQTPFRSSADASKNASDFKKSLLPDSEAPLPKNGTLPPLLKKPMLAGVLSAAVPGAGELYAGSWLRGSLFFAVEIALWAGYAHFHSLGQDWDGTFIGYADTHWSEPRYWISLAGPGQANIPGVDMNNYTQFLESLRNYEKEHFSHGLHLEKDQQYYEMIGKYDQFHAGWDDFVEGQPALTPHRDEYRNMRYKSNTAFKNASACAMGVLLNHVLSAFDAGWKVNSENKKIRTSFRSSWKQDDRGGMMMVSLDMAW